MVIKYDLSEMASAEVGLGVGQIVRTSSGVDEPLSREKRMSVEESSLSYRSYAQTVSSPWLPKNRKEALSISQSLRNIE